jgi:HEPN domain-containing protein
MAFLRQYEILIKKAKSDLKAGKNLLEDFTNGDDELDLETIMFHFQQCAEKLLKSLLIYNRHHIVKTHDIEDLILTIQDNNLEIISDVNKLIPLTEYAVEGRYAVIHDDLDDTDKYIKILDELLIYVHNITNK